MKGEDMRELFVLDTELDEVEDPGWQERALCAQTDPEAFFPEKGGSTREAKRVCSGCSVRAECLESALENDERFGIWGGLSERERRRLARASVAEGWNVRRTEAEARATSSADPTGAIQARRTGVHPDQEAAASQLGEAFGRALGADVKVTARGTGYKVAMTFDSLEEALELAGRLGAVEPV